MVPLEGNKLHEFMYGAEQADKIERFERGLAEIEKKYPDFFLDRKARLFPDEEDKLAFHYILIFNSYNITFGFTDDSDLPDYIKNECIKLFNSIYNAQVNG